MTPDRLFLSSAGRLSVAELADVADGRVRLSLDAGVLPALEQLRAAALTVSAPVYGRSTGVGANKDVVVDDPAGQATALLRSHATSAGELRSPRRVRAMLAVRAQQLATPGGGVAPAVLESLLRLLDGGVLPPVRELGGIGTADLSALATTALALDVELDEYDALAFLSSNAATIADAALALADLAVLARAAVVVASLSFTALDGNTGAYSLLAETTTPFPGALSVFAVMRALTKDVRAARIQDPFGLRCLPQAHGLLLDALATTAGIVETLAGTASENPLFSADGEVAHHGGFHAAYLATALDTVRSAVAQSAQLGLARLANLVDPTLTGLLPFLGDRPAASGVMVGEYVAASALAQLRHGATPSAVQAVSISRGSEDDASFASLGAAQALDCVGAYRTVVACELVAAVRALRQRRLPVPGPCAGLPTEMADRDLTQDIATAKPLLHRLADDSFRPPG